MTFLLSFILLVAACTSGSDSPATASSTSISLEPTDLLVPFVKAPANERFEVVIDGNNGPDKHVFVSFPRIEGAESFNEAVSQSVFSRVNTFSEHLDGIEPTGVAIPELTTSFDYIVASGDVVGVRLETYEFAGANGEMSWQTVYYDAKRDQARSAVELIDGEASFAELVEVVETKLDDHGFGPLPNPGASAEAANYDSVAFMPNGDMLVEFDEYQVAAGAEGRIVILVDKSTIDQWLSSFGRRVQAQVMTPDDDLALPSTTLPAPSTSALPTTTTTASTTTGPEFTKDVDCSVTACVALTFDDGPMSSTKRLLSILAERNVRVTFFSVGSNVVRNPDIALAQIDAGHEIGNHTFDHVDLSSRAAEVIHDQIQSTQDAIHNATGVAPTLLRPPYGATNSDVAAFGLPQIMWNVDPQDWKDRDVDTIARRVIENTNEGDIVLLHDIHPTTVDAVPIILDNFAERGLTVVPVTTLLGGNLTPGAQYYQR